MNRTITLSFTMKVNVPEGMVVSLEDDGQAVTVAPAPETPPHLDAPVTPADVVAALPEPPPVAADTPPDPNKLGSTEQLLLDELANNSGHLDHPGGLATGLLIASARCSSADAARQALARLDERGYIDRQIRGKRCYRIALTSKGWASARRSRVGAVQ